MGRHRLSSSDLKLQRDPPTELTYVTWREFAALQAQVVTMVTQVQALSEAVACIVQTQNAATAPDPSEPPHTPQLELSPLEMMESDVIPDRAQTPLLEAPCTAGEAFGGAVSDLLRISQPKCEETTHLCDALPRMSPPPRGTAAPPPPLCRTELNPAESLGSEVNGGDQHTLQTPLRTCSIKLEDCSKMLELNVIKEEEEDGYEMPSDVLKGDIEEETGDFTTPPHLSEALTGEWEQGEDVQLQMPFGVLKEDQEEEDTVDPTYLSEALAEEVEQEEPGDVFQLGESGNSSSASGKRQQHLETQRGEKPHHCSHCGKSFSSSSHLKTHQRIHTGEKPYHCSHCGKSFNRSDKLNAHMRIHTRERPYHCSQCEKSFTHSGNLNQHMRTHTRERPYICSHCGKSFRMPSHFKDHQRTHTGERPYHCSQCGKNFRQPSHFKEHQRTHTGERPFHCTQCGKSFTQSAHLKTHQRTHTEERPYQCSQCEKSFSRLGDLNTHQRIHTGDRPYDCSHCEKRFRQLSHFIEHQRTHTEARPYHSSQCVLDFYQ